MKYKREQKYVYSNPGLQAGDEMQVHNGFSHADEKARENVKYEYLFNSLSRSQWYIFKSE